MLKTTMTRNSLQPTGRLHTDPLRFRGTCVAGLRRLGLILAIGASLAQAAPPTKTLSEAQTDALALAGETAVRHARIAAKDTAPLRFEFHRQQAFAVPLNGTTLQLMSLAWWPEKGGEAHCALVFRPARGGASGHDVPFVDALAGAADAPPWACDGEPALRFTDVDGDGCTDVVALFPMRPPSGERFMQGLVLTCRKGNTLALDAERTRHLAERQSQGEPFRNVQQAEQCLINQGPHKHHH